MTVTKIRWTLVCESSNSSGKFSLDSCLGDRLEVNAQAVGYSQLAGNALSAVGQAECSPHWQQQFVQAARDVLPAVLDVQRAADRFIELAGLPVTECTPTALEGLSVLSLALPAAAGQDWRFALRPDARSISQRLNEGCAWVEQHRELNAKLSPLWPSRVVADAKQGIELLQQRRTTFGELSPAWPESVTDVLAQALALLGQIAEHKQQLSATYSDTIELLDIDLLLREWKEAEEAFWPKSWFGKRRIAGFLAPSQTTAGEADHGKDLATCAEIRAVRRAIDELELEPGHECVAVSLAKYRAAFFNMSRSSSRRRIWARRRKISLLASSSSLACFSVLSGVTALTHL